MKIEVTESNEKWLRFTLKGAKSSFANAIRRAAISGVATFAIEKVTFYENTSAMFDEYISHRVGLVPITTPAKGYGPEDEVLFTLDEVGPKTVYSKDLQASDKEVKVANGEIPIIKLAENQRLRLDGKAVMGTANRHAKFQPGLVTYDADKDTYNFYVESFGQMPPKEILNKTFDAIKDALKDVQKEVKKL